MKSITSDDILGKTAVDPHGTLLGTIVKLHIDNDKKAIQGITIDQGFMKADLFVGINYVKRFGIDTVLLSSMAHQRLKGRKVLSAFGKQLGVVSKVVAKEADLKTIIISKKTGVFKKEEKEISAADIKEIGETIILRKEWNVS